MFICCLLLPNLAFPDPAYCDDKSNYQVEAAFIYQFLNFTEWPPGAFSTTDNTITIGILGQNPFNDFFNPVVGTSINGRVLAVRHLPDNAPLVDLQKCQLLFISKKLTYKLNRIIASLAGLPILTVSESREFVYKGGMIGLFMKQNKVKFAINRRAAARAGITFRARLLRVADLVVEAGHE